MFVLPIPRNGYKENSYISSANIYLKDTDYYK